MKKSGLGPSSGISQKSNLSAMIPSALNGLLQCFDEALIALGPAKGGLQEVATVPLKLNALGEPKNQNWGKD